ncbi:hypothetical protein KCM76_16740 [Zooshikella marina]|uniref:Uncharacterized protein n=1 Tax=Zooshikella ganghwensis TaxID=202772 RepID=A0A4P9VMQ9_9GAMM|nr:hypothetical protein [Zooshikella ganghwensis]MBU2707644.1 hypothetical protein [Zooshikella ganghwensis]RDH44695.1 hypothetical protein B9G39_15340 [Zooshikella ganghwensis]
MPKYLYPTVYEQFTGQKPPEPQEREEKPKRPRRTHGHPYRMRHNMQQTQEQLPSDTYYPQQQEVNTSNHRNNQAKGQYPYSRGNRHYTSGNSHDYQPTENAYPSRRNNANTRVTYKKKRQYNQPQIGIFQPKHDYNQY